MKKISFRAAQTLRSGSRLGEFWKYRVGCLICKTEDDRLLNLVLPIDHRREVCR
jgi:hypothetical protein